MAKLRITYKKSAIGYSQDQKDTIRSLGLRKLNSSALHDDTPAIRGMAFKVRHLVTLEEVAEQTQTAEAAPSTSARAARRNSAKADGERKG
jgi:large subunit ribosomal protein L30